MKHFPEAYVGIAYVKDASPWEDRLGFMIPSDGKKTTVDSWAKTRSTKQAADLKTFDNEPIEGFTFGKHVNRYYNSNKKMRILDPRGFWLEISIENVADLMRSATISFGEVKEKCVWMRSGSDNYLLNADDPRYTSVAGLKATASYAVGDLVKIGQNQESVYLGKQISVVYGIATIFDFETRKIRTEFYSIKSPKWTHNYSRVLENYEGKASITFERRSTKAPAVILHAGHGMYNPEEIPNYEARSSKISTTASEDNMVKRETEHHSGNLKKTALNYGVRMFDTHEEANEFAEDVMTFNVTRSDKSIEAMINNIIGYDYRRTENPTVDGNIERIFNDYDKSVVDLSRYSYYRNYDRMSYAYVHYVYDGVKDVQKILNSKYHA